MKYNIEFVPHMPGPPVEPKKYGTGVGPQLNASPYVLCQECGHYSHPNETVYNQWSENMDCPACGCEVAGKTAFAAYVEHVLMPAAKEKNRQYEFSKH